MTTLNAKCSGAWRAADGTPVSIIETHGRVVSVVLCDAAAGYPVGRTVTLPTSWVTDDAPLALPAATVEVDAAPRPVVCALCGRPLAEAAP